MRIEILSVEVGLTRNARFHHVVVEDPMEGIFVAKTEFLTSSDEARGIARILQGKRESVASSFILEGEVYIPLCGKGFLIHGYTDGIEHDPPEIW